MSLLDDLEKFKQKTLEITKTAEDLKESIAKKSKEEKPKEPKPKKVEKPKTKCEYCQNYYTDIAKHYETCTDKKLATLMGEIESLRNMVLESKKEVILAEKPVVNKILRELEYNNFIENVMKRYNLKEFDKFVKFSDGRHIMFWSMEYCKQNIPNIYEDPTRFRVLGILNRIHRGDAKKYEFILNLAKEIVLDIIGEGSDK